MKQKKTRLLPFFIPHIGCPYICVFCNQPRISGHQSIPTPAKIEEEISKYISTSVSSQEWEIAYYGGSFTAIPREVQESLLAPATRAFQDGKIRGIRISTRPDAIAISHLGHLYEQGVRTIELGVQTLDENMLIHAKRGHTVEDVELACERIKDARMTLGIQLLPGLPGETWHTLLSTAVKAASLGPHLCRIYPVIVIADTELADMVYNGTYEPLSLELAIAYSAFLKTYLESKGIEIIRVGLQATEEFDAHIGIVGGPYAPAFGEMVVNAEFRQKIEYVLEQHRDMFTSISSIVIEYPRHCTSKVRGLKNSNVAYFHRTYEHIQWSWGEHSSSRRGVWMYIDGISYHI